MKKVIIFLVIIFIGVLGYMAYEANIKEQRIGRCSFFDKVFNKCSVYNGDGIPFVNFGKDYSNKLDEYGKEIVDDTNNRAEDLSNETKEVINNSGLVCCMTYPVVPSGENYANYSFTKEYECKVPCKTVEDDLGFYEDCAVGGAYKIVSDSYCN